MKVETYTLPAHWASALINDDSSGMSDDEIDALNNWYESNNPGYCTGCSDEPLIVRFDGLITECLEFTFTKPVTT